MRAVTDIDITISDVAPYLPRRPVILEAGSCNGDDTSRFVERWPDSTVYAFEPVPSAFAVTAQRTASLPQVRRFPLALSDRVGVAKMHVSSAADGGYRPDSSSLLAPVEHLEMAPDVRFTEEIEVPTTTIEAWAERENVARIDFMWLDMQGMELPALQHAGRVLDTTTAICMEVNRRELYAGCATYPEVMSWMKAKRFRPVIQRVSANFGNVLFVR
jgi:FkbM family methyltransferase